MSEDDKALCALLGRMVPNLRRRILRHADREPDLMNLDVLLLSSILHIRKEMNCGESVSIKI